MLSVPIPQVGRFSELSRDNLRLSMEVNILEKVNTNFCEFFFLQQVVEWTALNSNFSWVLLVTITLASSPTYETVNQENDYNHTRELFSIRSGSRAYYSNFLKVGKFSKNNSAKNASLKVV